MVFFVALAVCALLTATLVYRYDLYEHEPLPLLGVAVALGAGAMWVAGWVEGWVFTMWTDVGSLGIASVAAATEEIFKLLVVTVVAFLVPREFDDPMDGIVYGSMAGLGAALEESVFYTRSSSGLEGFVPAAELVRLWAHVVLGGIVGFPLGFWRAHLRHVLVAAPGGLFVALSLHLAWDAIVLSAGASVAPGFGRTLMGIILMVLSLALYGRLILTASARSRQQFAPLSSLQLWGWPFHRSSRPPDDPPSRGEEKPADR